jgi:hypothetical protein
MAQVGPCTPRGPNAPARGEETPRRSSFEGSGGGVRCLSEPSSLVRPFGSREALSPSALDDSIRTPQLSFRRPNYPPGQAAFYISDLVR